MLEAFELLMNAITSTPTLLAPISAGQPVNVSSDLQRTDLNKFLADEYSLLVRINGDSVTGCGIEPGDWVILSRSREPKTNDIIIASVNGEYTIKRLIDTPRRGLRLVPANPNYKERHLCDEDDCEILGVVTTIIKKFV
jgi:DNA polymerase V